MHRLTRQLAAALVALGLGLHVASAAAQSRTIEISELTPGTVFDGIIDGPPLQPPRDGTPDVGGFDMFVAFQKDIVEARSIVEFPLASLDDVLPEEIVAATLTFNVDDVISTLGPGSAFSNKAASVLYVHPYDADGTAGLSDYGKRDEPAYQVQTGGDITDASLNADGAVSFHVDVRDRLVAARAAGTPFLGFLWRTDDHPTATSIDDMGEGALGPPGSRDSTMPFLTIEVVDAPPPPNCGNGDLDDGETCDDGNNLDGDCCSRRCVRDEPGSACSDGDACTEGDVCSADGVCQMGAPLDCNDGEFCTDDSCDSATGCVNLIAHEGEACDDQNACTTEDVCGGGACRGASPCGDGKLDLTGDACSEECDDGNNVSVDGCSDVCTFDALLGNEKLMHKNRAKAEKSTKECLIQVALALPILDQSGGIAPVQRCTDNAPCDMDPAENVCGFELATCLGQADPRLPACSAVAANALQLKKPGKKDVNRSAIEGALAQTTFPGCSEPIRISVKVKGADNRDALLRPGKAMILVRTKVAGVGSDLDKVKFICDPPAS